MTAAERERLSREAGALKLRAMRLRALGDADDRWEAFALLRDAAGREIAALAAMEDPPPESRVSTGIEACALFLEARDPLRAVEQWATLPTSAFSAESAAAPIARLKPLYRAGVSAFADAWRSLLGPTGNGSVNDLRPDQLRTLVEAYPGVPELWWALSVQATSPGEAELARARAVRLDPSFASDEAGQSAWNQIEPSLAHRLRIELSSERRGGRVNLELACLITRAFAELLAGFADITAESSVHLGLAGSTVTPGAKPGCIAVDVCAEWLRPFALAELDRELEGSLKGLDASVALELLALLHEHRVRLAVSVVSPSPEPGVTIDAARRKIVIPAAKAAAQRTLDTNDIPQADDIERVFRIVDRMVKNNGDDTDPPDITPRQISYYRRAAKILGLLTGSDQPTAAGRLLSRIDAVERLRAGVIYFESSVCGDAWIRWAKGRTLLDVAPTSAADFLRQCVPGLSKDTAERRAQTLIAWYKALIVHHYAR